MRLSIEAARAFHAELEKIAKLRKAVPAGVATLAGGGLLGGASALYQQSPAQADRILRRANLMTEREAKKRKRVRRAITGAATLAGGAAGGVAATKAPKVITRIGDQFAREVLPKARREIGGAVEEGIGRKIEEVKKDLPSIAKRFRKGLFSLK